MSRFHPRLRPESVPPETAKKQRSHFAELRAAGDIPPPEERVPAPVATVLKKVSERPLAAPPAPARVPVQAGGLHKEGEAMGSNTVSFWGGVVRAFVALVLAAALFGAMALAYWAGTTSDGAPAPASPAAPSLAALRKEALPEFNAALESFRAGRLTEAEDQLDKIETLFPESPAVVFLQLLVAMQDGRFTDAGRLVDRCLAANYRRSDVLAVQAAMAALSNPPQPDEQRRLLEQSVLADPMNPAPFIEQAGLARFLGNEREAAEGLSAAALRFQPAVSLSIVRTIAALAKPAPADAKATGNPENDFPAALSEFRAGRRESALAILRSTRTAIDPDTSFYILNDPAFRPYLTGEQIRDLLASEVPAPSSEIGSPTANES